MPTPEEQKLDRMLTDFSALHDSATTHPGRNLRDLIDKTPELKAVVLESIKNGNLDKFENLNYPGAVGSYDADNKAMAVSVGQLGNADRNVQSANTLRFTLGHELQHAVNRQDILDQDANFKAQAAVTAGQPSPHDYTQALKDYNAKSREIETKAEIAGFNMLAAEVTRQNPKATLKDLYDASPNDMQMYIDADLSKTPATYTPKPGLTIGADLKLASTPQNVETMGKLFYDANGYPQREVGRAVGMIQDAEATAARNNPGRAAPEIRVDLKEIGISGTLPPGFTDTSKPRLQPQPAEAAPAEAAPARDAAAPGLSARDPRNAANPDHSYYQMLRDKLPGSVPDNAVAQSMYDAKLGGLTDPSKVDPNRIGFSNGNVWVGGNTPGFQVGTNAAQSPPMEQVAERLDTLRQQGHSHGEQQTQQQTQQQAAQRSQGEQRPPVQSL